jgi:hypothetical protein
MAFAALFMVGVGHNKIIVQSVTAGQRSAFVKVPW